MKKITSLPEFVTWAKEVNNCPQSTKRWCDLQDIYAHSEEKNLIGWYTSKEADPDRRILLFAVYKCMGEDPFMRLVNSLALKSANEKIHEWVEVYNKELDSRHTDLRKLEIAAELKKSALDAREKEGPAWRKAAFKKIQGYKGLVAHLEEKKIKLTKRVLELETQLAERPINGKPKRMISV